MAQIDSKVTEALSRYFIPELIPGILEFAYFLSPYIVSIELPKYDFYGLKLRELVQVTEKEHQVIKQAVEKYSYLNIPIQPLNFLSNSEDVPLGDFKIDLLKDPVLIKNSYLIGSRKIYPNSRWNYAVYPLFGEIMITLKRFYRENTGYVDNDVITEGPEMGEEYDPESDPLQLSDIKWT